MQEIKAKEMDELAKTLAELGIAAPAMADEEDTEAADDKRKKKKDRKKPKAEGNGEVSLPETNGTAKENEPMEEPVEEESSESLDPAEVSSSPAYRHKTSANSHNKALEASGLRCPSWHAPNAVALCLQSQLRLCAAHAEQYIVQASYQLLRRQPAQHNDTKWIDSIQVSACEAAAPKTACLCRPSGFWRRRKRLHRRSKEAPQQQQLREKQKSGPRRPRARRTRATSTR